LRIFQVLMVVRLNMQGGRHHHLNIITPSSFDPTGG